MLQQWNPGLLISFFPIFGFELTGYVVRVAADDARRREAPAVRGVA